MRFTALAKRNLKEMYRDPFTLILSILMPAAILLLMWAITQSEEEALTGTWLVPGCAVLGFAMLFLFSGTALSRDRDSALLSRLLTTPLKSSDFILAYSLPYVIIAAIQIAVLFAVATPLKLEIRGNVGIALIPLMLMAICFIGLGMFFGSLFNEKQTGGIAWIVILPAIFLGDVIFPIEAIGGAFQDIGNALPFAHASQAAKDVMMEGAGLGDIATDLGWVLGYTLIFFTLGVLCFRWRTKG